MTGAKDIQSLNKRSWCNDVWGYVLTNTILLKLPMSCLWNCNKQEYLGCGFQVTTGPNLPRKTEYAEVLSIHYMNCHDVFRRQLLVELVKFEPCLTYFADDTAPVCMDSEKSTKPCWWLRLGWTRPNFSIQKQASHACECKASWLCTAAAVAAISTATLLPQKRHKSRVRVWWQVNGLDASVIC